MGLIHGIPARSHSTLTHVIKTKEHNVQKTFTNILKLSLPHVGLVILLIFYIFIGGFLFFNIESYYEENVRQDLLARIPSQRNILDELWRVAEKESMTKEEFEIIANKKLDELSAMVDEAVNEPYTVSHMVNNNSRTIWSIQSSILFAITTLTTVGYGSPSPRTKWGRIFCIAYAMFGIPLTLITVADLAKFATLFGGFVWKQVSKMYELAMNPQSKNQEIKGMDVNGPESLLDLHKPMKLIMLLTMSLMIIYPMVAGVIVQISNPEWNLFECFYVSFVTMLTIGYGDYIPDSMGLGFYITVFIIFGGLIITTICVDVVGGEMIVQIHYLGRKLKDARGRMQAAFGALSEMRGFGGLWFGMGNTAELWNPAVYTAAYYRHEGPYDPSEVALSTSYDRSTIHDL